MKTPTVGDHSHANHTGGHAQNQNQSHQGQRRQRSRQRRVEEEEEEAEALTMHPRAFAVWGHDESDSSAASDSDP